MKRLRLTIGIGVLAAMLLPALVYAQYTSTNYKSSEVFFGSGGDNSQTSANYSANTSLGSLGAGTGTSTNYQANYGFLTPSEPFLSMTVNTASVSLGTLNTGTTATGTSTFTVTAYVDSGYTVQSVSPPPSYTSGSGSHTLTGMPFGGSTIGTEQFGINLRQNLSPIAFGNDPAAQPGGFANGQAAPNYSTGGSFKYSAGDTIACTGSAPGVCTGASGWGSTLFTISYIANISLVTPAGNYSVNQDLVVVATY